jgi:hypothetical protein
VDFCLRLGTWRYDLVMADDRRPIGGFVQIDSHSERGGTVSIYLPSVEPGGRDYLTA